MVEQRALSADTRVPSHTISTNQAATYGYAPPVCALLHMGMKTWLCNINGHWDFLNDLSWKLRPALLRLIRPSFLWKEMRNIQPHLEWSIRLYGCEGRCRGDMKDHVIDCNVIYHGHERLSYPVIIQNCIHLTQKYQSVLCIQMNNSLILIEKTIPQIFISIHMNTTL